MRSGRASSSAQFDSLDKNNDGNLDLVVGTLGGPIKLWLGDGKGRFTDATASSGLAGGYAATALTFADVEKHAKRVPWETIASPGRRVRFRVTCRKSRLYHSGAVAQRLMAALVAQGTTSIENIYQINRGYENIVARLQGIGAEITQAE